MIQPALWKKLPPRPRGTWQYIRTYLRNHNVAWYLDSVKDKRFKTLKPIAASKEVHAWLAAHCERVKVIGYSRRYVVRVTQ